MHWIFSILMSFQVYGESAHVHGEGQINLAFEGQEGQIEIDVPAEAILGFESVAKTEKEKTKEKESLEIFNNLSQLIGLDSKWGCQIQPKKIEFVSLSPHRDLEASYKVRCARAVARGHIDFKIQKSFPTWKKVKIQIITPTVQKSAIIIKNGESLELN